MGYTLKQLEDMSKAEIIENENNFKFEDIRALIALYYYNENFVPGLEFYSAQFKNSFDTFVIVIKKDGETQPIEVHIKPSHTFEDFETAEKWEKWRYYDDCDEFERIYNEYSKLTNEEKESVVV